MAIKVIRICDKCGGEHEQIIEPTQETYECPVAFECSDCILEEALAQIEKGD